MDAGYTILGNDVDVCRMFDQFSYKVSSLEHDTRCTLYRSPSKRDFLGSRPVYLQEVYA